MENITLVLAVLLGSGFFVAKAGQLLRLPSVTGYILAGLLLGPSCLNLLSAHTIGHQLGHFTQIALMMIAFGIGEHLEIKRVSGAAGSVITIGVAEVLCTFVFVAGGTFVVARMTGIGPEGWTVIEYVALSLLLGAVSVATAPAATMHVMRELGAAGPLTTSLMAVVAIDNGLAIMMFGVSIAVVPQLFSAGSGAAVGAFSSAMFEIAGSLMMGGVTGLLIDLINSRLRAKNEMLTSGLALLLLCGEGARFFHMSPLLAGMAAGFTIVNRDHRDLRLFRALNAFEPPIYVLFFTLAGVHLNLAALVTAGELGFAYFILRSVGKMLGAGLGARIAEANHNVQRYLGLSLLPQAGVAIGLVFLISDEPSLKEFSTFITPVVLAGVVLSEIVGPVMAKFAVVRAGEAREVDETSDQKYTPLSENIGTQVGAEPHGVPMVPWTWERLDRPVAANGVVVFGANHLATTAALARVATILANYHRALPLAARVISENGGRYKKDKAIMEAAKHEVKNMGSELYTVTSMNEDAAEGLLQIAQQTKTRAIVLGQSMGMTPPDFEKIIGRVIKRAPCMTVVIKFSGVFHSECILVPFVAMRELHLLKGPIKALAAVGRHQITFLRLMPSYERKTEVDKAESRLLRWVEMEGLAGVSVCHAMATDSRKEAVLEESKTNDLVIMAGPGTHGLQRIFFGSLVVAVGKSCAKTFLTVYPPG